MNRSIIRTSDYVQQVNRHLASATYLLNAFDTLPSASHPWQRRASCESAALQLYFALRTYLNEIISYYSKSCLPTKQVIFGELIENPPDLLWGTAEFRELRLLLQSADSSWRILCDLPLWLANTEQQKKFIFQSAEFRSRNSQSPDQTIERIDVKEREQGEELLDPVSIRSMIKTLSALIECQRNNQRES